MFNKKMRLIGVSIFVCLAAIVAVPAFAAAPAHGSSAGHTINGTGEAKILGFAENLTASLQQKGVDVTNLNAALTNAQSAIQNADATAFKDAMKTFDQEIQAGIRNGSISKTALQGTGHQCFQKSGVTLPAMNTTVEKRMPGFAENLTPTMETKMLGFAENLTASLQQKGADVTNLNAALTNAQSAIQNADATAFKDAMKTFDQEIQAGLRNGSIDKSVLRQPGQNPGAGNHSFAFTKNHVKNQGSVTPA
jgi:SOS response regulatory protein OraA/RecX